MCRLLQCVDLCKVEPSVADCELQPKIQPHIIPTQHRCISYAFKELGHKKWPVNVFGHFESITSSTQKCQQGHRVTGDYDDDGNTTT